jgi:hypothetical protein
MAFIWLAQCSAHAGHACFPKRPKPRPSVATPSPEAASKNVLEQAKHPASLHAMTHAAASPLIATGRRETRPRRTTRSGEREEHTPLSKKVRHFSLC